MKLKIYIKKICGIDMIIGEDYIINDELFTFTNCLDSTNKETFYVFETKNYPSLIYKMEESFVKHRIQTGEIRESIKILSNDDLDAIGYNLQSLGWLYKQKPQLKVYFNDKKKATTLIDGDNVVVVKTKKGEKYNRRIGFLEAYFELKSGMSKTQKNKYLDEVTNNETKKRN